jgi:hypothetical protein
MPVKSFLRFLFTTLMSVALVVYGGNRHALSDPHSAIAIQKAGHGALTASTRSAPHEDLLAEHQRGDQLQAIRTRLDAQRARFWVLTIGHVYVYDTRKRTLIRRIALPNWPVADFACPPDIALDRDGTAYISSNVQPRLLQIDPSSFLSREHQLRQISPRQLETGFGALAFGRDGTLRALSAVAGLLFEIDVAGRVAREIARSEPVAEACTLGGSHDSATKW